MLDDSVDSMGQMTCFCAISFKILKKRRNVKKERMKRKFCVRVEGRRNYKTKEMMGCKSHPLVSPFAAIPPLFGHNQRDKKENMELEYK